MTQQANLPAYLHTIPC